MEKLFLQIYLNGRNQSWNELSTVYNLTGEQLRKKYSKWKKKYEDSRTYNYSEQVFTKDFVDKYNRTSFANPPLNTLYEITRNLDDFNYVKDFNDAIYTGAKTNPFKPMTVPTPTYEQIKYATNMESYENILIIGDIHEPFGHEGYLQHCLDTMKKYQCTKVIFIGDEVDLHSLSFHEHNPNLYSPGQEIELAKKRLAKWYNAFPNAIVLGANHSDLIKRKMKHAGIPEEIAKPMNEIFGTPNWTYVDNYVYQNILFTHGTGLSASSVNTKALYENKSVVIGHLHTSAKIEYLKQDIFTLCVGCGISYEHPAFDYARTNPKKPILSCGVIFHKLPLIVPMTNV